MYIVRNRKSVRHWTSVYVAKGIYVQHEYIFFNSRVLHNIIKALALMGKQGFSPGL